jgi:hypothetical protein
VSGSIETCGPAPNVRAAGKTGSDRRSAKTTRVLTQGGHRSVQIVALVLALICISVTPSLAETGSVRVVITKRALIIGSGEGTGTLTFKGHSYPLKISAISFGATIGASKTTLTGNATNVSAPSDIEGSYGAIGTGSSLGVGAGGARLKNDKGVELLLSAVKVGAEMTVAVSAVTISILSQRP